MILEELGMHTGCLSVEVPSSSNSGSYGPVRRINLPVGPQLHFHGCYTLHEVFLRGVHLAPDSPCAGTRQGSDFQWQTYSEIYERVVNFRSGMDFLNLWTPVSDGSIFCGFLGVNRAEWLVGEQACYSNSVIPVPMYDQLDSESLKLILEETEMSVLVCSPNMVDAVLEVRPSCLQSIVVMGEGAPGSKTPSDLKLYGMTEIETIGIRNKREGRMPGGSDVAFLCYTSGTMGVSKGALITHSNIITVLAALNDLIPSAKHGDVYLSYLPLAHIYERTLEITLLGSGAAIGFFSGDPALIVEDLKALRPTIFCSVPRLLNRLYDAIHAQVDKKSVWAAQFFRYAKRVKLQNMQADGSLTHTLYDYLVFQPILKQLGLDRCWFMATGASPLSKEVMAFLRILMGFVVVEAYGQTESSCAITSGLVTDNVFDSVGLPVPCNEVRLQDVPDMGYSQNDRFHRISHSESIPCVGRGEICFRGPNVFQGYYKNPEKTAETISSDGWCHTGDIGLWTNQGYLRIIDRKKNIFKLAQGEYIAPEKIEGVLSLSSFVSQIWVHGDSLRDKLVAVVVPDTDYLLGYEAKISGPPGRSMAALCADQRINQVILADIIKMGTEKGLRGFEIPRAIFLEPVPFSFENKLLTPTFKLKRFAVLEHYQQEMAHLYESLSSEDPKNTLFSRSKF